MDAFYKQARKKGASRWTRRVTAIRRFLHVRAPERGAGVAGSPPATTKLKPYTARGIQLDVEAASRQVRSRPNQNQSFLTKRMHLKALYTCEKWPAFSCVRARRRLLARNAKHGAQHEFFEGPPDPSELGAETINSVATPES